MGLKTLFIITITTARMIFPGVSAVMPSSGDATQPVVIPAVRSLTLDLMSNAKAGPNATAQVSLPPGLKADGPASVTINRSKKAAQTSVSKGGSGAKYVYKSYWGCADAVPAGQPKSIDSSSIANSGAAKTPSAQASPYASYASWQGGAKPVAEEAAAQGAYTLTTNYCGSTSINLDKEQNFLDPIRLIGMGDKIDLTKPVTIKWKPIPHAVAYLVTAVGGSEKESIAWTSSSDPQMSAGFGYKPVSKDDLATYTGKKILLPADATSCTIPAGIFKSVDSAFLTVTALGIDKTQEQSGVTTEVIVRSVASVPIAGMQGHYPFKGADQDSN